MAAIPTTTGKSSVITLKLELPESACDVPRTAYEDVFLVRVQKLLDRLGSFEPRSTFRERQRRRPKRATPSTLLLWSAPNYTGDPRPDDAITMPLPETVGFDDDNLNDLEELGFDREYLDTFPTAILGRQLEEASQRFCAAQGGDTVHIPRHTFQISNETFEAVIQQSAYRLPHDVESLRRVLVFDENVADVAQETGQPFERFKKRVQRVRARAKLLQSLIEEQKVDDQEQMQTGQPDHGELPKPEKWIRWKWRQKTSVNRNELWVDIQERPSLYPWAGVTSPRLNRSSKNYWNSAFILVPHLGMGSLQETLTRQKTGKVRPGGAGPDVDEWDEAEAWNGRGEGLGCPLTA